MREDERIEDVKTWPEPQSVRDIQVFFLPTIHQRLCRIARSLTSMIKTTTAGSKGPLEDEKVADVEVGGGWW